MIFTDRKELVWFFVMEILAKNMDIRDFDIFLLKRQGWSFTNIGKKYNLTKARTYQIYSKTIRRFKKLMHRIPENPNQFFDFLKDMAKPNEHPYEIIYKYNEVVQKMH